MKQDASWQPAGRRSRMWLRGLFAASAAALAVAIVAAGMPGTPAAAAAVTKHVMRGWGTNNDGELGHGTRSTLSDTPVTVVVPKGAIVTSVRAGCDHSVALTSTGRVLAWGDNAEGQLGDGTTTSRDKPVYARLPKHTKIKAVRAGCDDSIALTTTGRVLTWGLGVEGALGNGSKLNRHTPVYVKLPKGVKVTAITAGCHHNLALTSSGRLLAWGLNLDGQLGDGNTSNRDTPAYVKLPKGAKATSVAAGCQHSLAITSDGLFGWGRNTDGQLGNGTTTSTDKPVRIIFLMRGRPLGRITGLFAGCQHTIALFSHGAVLTWGGNAFGQLGNGTTTSSDKPVGVKLPAGVTVTAVSAGCYTSFALTRHGGILAWGYDAEGQLGDGFTVSSDTPVPVKLPAGFGSIAIGAGPGAQHAFVIAPAKPG
jgi:alpha-tubulin suppressor-like RCC1 family protein